MAILAFANNQELSVAPLTPAYASGFVATTNSYTFPNDGKVFLHVKKSGAGSCTVTVTTPATYKGNAVADTTFAVPASTGDVMAGPFPPELYNDQTGLVSVVFSEVTGLTAAVIHMPNA